MTIDLGRLLRLRGAVRSTAGTAKPTPADAFALTDGYSRLRAQVGDLVSEQPETAEFTAMFPEIEIVSAAGPGHGDLIEWHHQASTAATHAQGLLNQMAGWIDGLVDEQTLSERIQAEAAERVKYERGGFEGV